MTLGKVIGKWFCVNHRAIFVLIRIGIVFKKKCNLKTTVKIYNIQG